MKTSTIVRDVVVVLLGHVQAGVIPDNQHVLSPYKYEKLLEEIPSVGLGLWKCLEENATLAVSYGFRAGYQLLDSASSYHNEQYVGKALDSERAPERSSYWVTSKVWNDMHRPANVRRAFDGTLRDLRLDYLDLYLMHWPISWLPPSDLETEHLHTASYHPIDNTTNIIETWKAMEQLVAKDPRTPEKGTTRYIGVSNFNPAQLQQILDICTICPYAHEFETHPYLQQSEFVNFHRTRDIKVIAYSPLANTNPKYWPIHPELPHILENPFWMDIARRKNVTVAQAVLGWNVARGVVVIPKSLHEQRLVENLAAENVKFTPTELEVIAKQDKHARFSIPDWGVPLFEGLDDSVSA